MERILILNGPNLNMLGSREKDIYGKSSIEDLKSFILKECENLPIHVDFFQSNHEGIIMDKLHEAKNLYQGIVINPGAFTHYSYAIYDAIKAIDLPTVEVHISNIHTREEFRQKSVTAKACIGQIAGFHFYSYVLGIYAVLENLRG